MENKLCKFSAGLVLLGLVCSNVFAATPSLPVVQPKALLNPPTKTPAAVFQPLSLMADLVDSQPSKLKIKAKNIHWQCQAERCESSVPWPSQAVQACRALASQVGRVTRFHRGSQKLNAAQLKQCNQGVTSSQLSLPKVPPGLNQSHPALQAPIGNTVPLQPGARQSPATAHAPPSMVPPAPPVPLPAANISPAVIPSPGGGIGVGSGRADRPSNRDAVAAIREAAAARAQRAIIASIHQGEVCAVQSSRSDSGFAIRGSRFGTAAAGRKLMLVSQIRHRAVAEIEVLSWSDTLIRARIPYPNTRIHDGQAYVLGIQDAHGRWVSNLNRQIHICPNQVQVSGQIALHNCAAGMSNLRVGLNVDGRVLRDLQVSAVPGNDFVMQYRATLPAQDTMRVQLTLKLVGVSCPGGQWTPLNRMLNLGYRRFRATQDFEYRVEQNRFSLPMRAVAGLIRDAFNGTTMRINNFDPATRRHRANDTQLVLSAALGGSTQTFNIPAVVQDPREYYINNINLDNIQVAPTRDGLKVTLDFENNGVEFRGFCRPSSPGERINCALGAPDVQASLSVDIYLRLARYYSRGAPLSVSFSNVRVEAHPNAQASGFCEAIDICNAFTDYKRLIRESVERSLLAALDTRRVRDDVANALRPSLTGFGIGAINAVRVEGNYLVIEYLPAG